MNCRACNTRIPTGANICPHCGHAQRTGDPGERGSKSHDEPAEATSHSRLSPSNLGPHGRGPTVDVELDDEVELPLESAMAMGDGVSPSKSKSTTASKPATKPAERARPTAPARPKATDDPASSQRTVTDAFLSLDPAQLRHLVAEHPELLEPGLGVHVDDAGAEIGAGFETEAGEIDLLGRGRQGDLVVVMVVEPPAGGDLIAQILQRIGWVRKHVARRGQAVRGIVLIDELEDDLQYAASAVSDSIQFKTWRLSLTFERIDV